MGWASYLEDNEEPRQGDAAGVPSEWSAKDTAINKQHALVLIERIDSALSDKSQIPTDSSSRLRINLGEFVPALTSISDSLILEDLVFFAVRSIYATTKSIEVTSDILRTRSRNAADPMQIFIVHQLIPKYL